MRKAIKYQRYVSIIKACKLIRKNDKSYLGLNTMNYAIKSKLTKFDKYIKHKTYLKIISSITDLVDRKKR